MMAFVIGFFAGGLLGFFAAALACAAGKSDPYDDV